MIQWIHFRKLTYKMQFQETARFFANTKCLIEKVKETRLKNLKYEEKINKLTHDLTELRNDHETRLKQDDILIDEKTKNLSSRILELERDLKRYENTANVLELEKRALFDDHQKCLRYVTELELKVKSYESESSLQISQTELALSRLTALRSQLIQLQNSNEKMEEFLARFKSTVSSVKSKNHRLEYDKDILQQKLEESKDKISSLQETILQLTAEKETLKSRVHLEGKISQYAEACYNEEFRAFDQVKQKIETLMTTFENTMVTAEQSGILFLQHRTMLSQMDRHKENRVANEQEPVSITHNPNNDKTSVSPKNLDEVMNADERDEGMEE